MGEHWSPIVVVVALAQVLVRGVRLVRLVKVSIVVLLWVDSIVCAVVVRVVAGEVLDRVLLRN
jgi:hypothetical protein